MHVVQICNFHNESGFTKGYLVKRYFGTVSFVLFNCFLVGIRLMLIATTEAVLNFYLIMSCLTSILYTTTYGTEWNCLPFEISICKTLLLVLLALSCLDLFHACHLRRMVLFLLLLFFVFFSLIHYLVLYISLFIILFYGSGLKVLYSTYTFLHLRCLCSALWLMQNIQVNIPLIS